MAGSKPSKRRVTRMINMIQKVMQHWSKHYDLQAEFRQVFESLNKADKAEVEEATGIQMPESSLYVDRLFGDLGA